MRCVLCNSENNKFLLKATDTYMNVDDKVYDLIQCRDCKLTTLNPILSDDELRKYYPSDYKIFDKQLKITCNDKSFLSNFRTRLIKLLRLNTLELILEKYSSQNINYLDYGCGNGKNIFTLSNKFSEWSFYGYDKFNDNILDLKEKRIFFYDKKNFELIKDEYFDIINLSSVIEHVNNPKELISFLYKKLKKKGIIIIKTPNFQSLSRKIFQKNWHNLDIPRHFHIFSEENLNLLLEMHNLKKIKTIYSRNSGVELKSFYKILNLQKKPKFHQLFLKIFNPITFILSFFNLTSTFTIVSKKD